MLTILSSLRQLESCVGGLTLYEISGMNLATKNLPTAGWYHVGEPEWMNDALRFYHVRS